MLKILIILMVLGVLFIVLTAVIVGARHERYFMTSWEKCNGNCSNCRDKEQCMNRSYK